VPINFYVDEQGVFHTLPLYRLVDLYLLIVAPITTILLIRCKAALKQKIVALSFIVTPILHYILTSGAHGYASQYGSTLFAVTQIYSVLFSDNSRKLASTKTELHLARSVQASIIPKDFFQERKEFDVYASMEPAREVGGDFYDVFLADDDHLVMAMADVSGKGVPSAMYMMVAKIVMKNSAMFGENPASVLRTMNRAICSNNKEEMFVTIWIGVLEISTGILTASNAGHEYPILMRNGRPYEVYKDNHGMVIGAFEDSKYSEYQIAMQPGDKLFLYTDGIPEAMNKNRKQFGMDNLVAALNETCDKDPEETLQHVRKSVDAFVKGAEQFDDLTMMCIRYNGRKDV
jgi:serine phosphatase RsbU (regulator of sigma subunit)